MSQEVTAPTRKFKPSAAITQFARVVQASDGTVSTAGVQRSIGVAADPAFTTGINPLANIAVRMNTAQGTRKMIAAGSIPKGATVYAAAAGKVSTTPNAYPEGVCFDGASADNDVCEVEYLPIDGLQLGGVAAGYRIARGVAAITGTGTVVTGLSTVVSVTATASDDPDGVALAMVSATIGDQDGSPAAGSVILKCWKVTATGNATLIAATAAKNVNWIAVGT